MYTRSVFAFKNSSDTVVNRLESIKVLYKGIRNYIYFDADVYVSEEKHFAPKAYVINK